MPTLPNPSETMKILVFFATLLFGSSALANPAQDLFDEVSYYLVINYGGLSSANVRGLPDKYQPQLDAACIGMANTCPVERAYPVIQAMMLELNDDHSGFYPNSGAAAQGALTGSTQNRNVGIGLARLENKVYVRQVAFESSAYWRGVRRGDQITHIGLRPIPTNEEKFAAVWQELNTNGGMVTLQRQGQVVRAALNALPQAPELPSLEMRQDGVAVLRIPGFFGRGQGSVAQKVHQLLASINAKSLVLELRDNPGGFVADCTGVAGAFLERVSNRFAARTAFGAAEYFYQDQKVWLRRANAESVVVDLAIKARFAGRVAVLQNQGSASCSEFVASNLQEVARAKVYGTPSAGVANTSVGFFFLSSDSLLALSLNTRVRPDNTPHAAKVQPDVMVADDLVGLNQTGKDAVLERALQDLKAQ
jgi:carboxyl-terminal processing protease